MPASFPFLQLTVSIGLHADDDWDSEDEGTAPSKPGSPRGKAKSAKKARTQAFQKPPKSSSKAAAAVADPPAAAAAAAAQDAGAARSLAEARQPSGAHKPLNLAGDAGWCVVETTVGTGLACHGSVSVLMIHHTLPNADGMKRKCGTSNEQHFHGAELAAGHAYLCTSPHFALAKLAGSLDMTVHAAIPLMPMMTQVKLAAWRMHLRQQLQPSAQSAQSRSSGQRPTIGSSQPRATPTGAG